MTKIKAALAALGPYRKAIVAAALAALGSIAVQLNGEIDWKAVLKAALVTIGTGAGVYQTTNTPTPQR